MQPAEIDILPDRRVGDPGQQDETAIILLHELAASLGKAIDAKDAHTMAHSEEVAEVARALARGLGLGRRLAECIHVAGHLHDIGKIGVPDAVLGKAGALSPDEWACMRTHPDKGAEILGPLTSLARTGVVEMVRAHHERFDGRGYPRGLRGRDIPLGARIIAVADSLSAMLQTRPYRPAMTFAAATCEIVRCAGSQFDPEVVTIFLAQQSLICRRIQACRNQGGRLTGKGYLDSVPS